MAAGRRGRPYQVPEDTTSVRASTVDVHARVGWLLLMSRLHHPDPELALGDSFNAALSAVGVQADRSAVSRWESGKATPRYSVLVGYERVLGLQEGQLTSVVNAQRREFSDDGLASWAPVLDPRSTGFHERLDALFDALLAGPGTGPEWTALAQHVAATRGMYVHGSVWRHLSTALINQLTRSVGAAYLERMEAIRLLLEHPVAHQWLLRATDEFLDDPAVQVVNDPIGVLEISTAPAAADVVLDKMLTTRSPQVLTAAVEAVAAKIQGGSYSASQLEQIERSVVSRLRGPDASAVVFEELTLVMPEAASERLLLASRGVAGHEELAKVAAHGEIVDPGVARRVSQRIARTACAQLPACGLYEEDKMTPRLVREALSRVAAYSCTTRVWRCRAARSVAPSPRPWSVRLSGTASTTRLPPGSLGCCATSRGRTRRNRSWSGFRRRRQQWRVTWGTRWATSTAAGASTSCRPCCAAMTPLSTGRCCTGWACARRGC